MVPKTALTEQDRLRQMKKRKDESWSEFLDRYSLYAGNCQHVEDSLKVSELYRKLPKEIRNMLVHMPANVTYEVMKQNLSHIRYWQSCTNEANTLVDPMDIDCVWEGRRDVWEGTSETEDLNLGEGRLRRPVL